MRYLHQDGFRYSILLGLLDCLVIGRSIRDNALFIFRERCPSVGGSIPKGFDSGFWARGEYLNSASPPGLLARRYKAYRRTLIGSMRRSTEMPQRLSVQHLSWYQPATARQPRGQRTPPLFLRLLGMVLLVVRGPGWNHSRHARVGDRLS